MIRTFARWIAGPHERTAYRYRWWHNDKTRGSVMGWGYAVVGLLSFGYDIARYPKVTFDCDTKTVTYVIHEDGTQTEGPDEKRKCTYKMATPETVISGLAAGVLWPLFWTWEASSRLIDPVLPPLPKE